jgi:hypothetical protein
MRPIARPDNPPADDEPPAGYASPAGLLHELDPEWTGLADDVRRLRNLGQTGVEEAARSNPRSNT